MPYKKYIDLNEKVCVVIGGAGLLGKEFIKAISYNKGIAIVADKNIDLANQVKKNLSEELNLKTIDSVKIDISSKQNLIECIEYLKKKYGKIDALVNSAYPKNKNFGKDFFETEHSDFVENLSLHLGGYFLTSQQFAVHFKKQGYGNIINISSIYGTIIPNFEIYKDTSVITPVEYIAIKSGLIHLTKYMAKYFKGMNIRVNSLSPGGIYDDQPEKFLQKYKSNCLNKGMLDKTDICGALIYLLSDMSEYLNGQNIIIDDGFSL
jgi:NAD(P)-dependent dehydrogenase (short-subunit alcohol dehydrogenase family)